MESLSVHDARFASVSPVQILDDVFQMLTSQDTAPGEEIDRLLRSVQDCSLLPASYTAGSSLLHACIRTLNAVPLHVTYDRLFDEIVQLGIFAIKRLRLRHPWTPLEALLSSIVELTTMGGTEPLLLRSCALYRHLPSADDSEPFLDRVEAVPPTGAASVLHGCREAPDLGRRAASVDCLVSAAVTAAAPSRWMAAFTDKSAPFDAPSARPSALAVHAAAMDPGNAVDSDGSAAENGDYTVETIRFRESLDATAPESASSRVTSSDASQTLGFCWLSAAAGSPVGAAFRSVFAPLDTNSSDDAEATTTCFACCALRSRELKGAAGMSRKKRRTAAVDQTSCGNVDAQPVSPLLSAFLPPFLSTVVARAILFVAVHTGGDTSAATPRYAPALADSVTGGLCRSALLNPLVASSASRVQPASSATTPMRQPAFWLFGAFASVGPAWLLPGALTGLHCAFPQFQACCCAADDVVPMSVFYEIVARVVSGAGTSLKRMQCHPAVQTHAASGCDKDCGSCSTLCALCGDAAVVKLLLSALPAMVPLCSASLFTPLVARSSREGPADSSAGAGNQSVDTMTVPFSVMASCVHLLPRGSRLYHQARTAISVVLLRHLHPLDASKVPGLLSGPILQCILQNHADGWDGLIAPLVKVLSGHRDFRASFESAVSGLADAAGHLPCHDACCCPPAKRKSKSKALRTDSKAGDAGIERIVHKVVDWPCLLQRAAAYRFLACIIHAVPLNSLVAADVLSALRMLVPLQVNLWKSLADLGTSQHLCTAIDTCCFHRVASDVMRFSVAVFYSAVAVVDSMSDAEWLSIQDRDARSSRRPISSYIDHLLQCWGETSRIEDLPASVSSCILIASRHAGLLRDDAVLSEPYDGLMISVTRGTHAELHAVCDYHEADVFRLLAYMSRAMEPCDIEARLRLAQLVVGLSTRNSACVYARNDIGPVIDTQTSACDVLVSRALKAVHQRRKSVDPAAIADAVSEVEMCVKYLLRLSESRDQKGLPKGQLCYFVEDRGDAESVGSCDQKPAVENMSDVGSAPAKQSPIVLKLAELEDALCMWLSAACGDRAGKALGSCVLFSAVIDLCTALRRILVNVSFDCSAEHMQNIVRLSQICLGGESRDVGSASSCCAKTASFLSITDVLFHSNPEITTAAIESMHLPDETLPPCVCRLVGTLSVFSTEWSNVLRKQLSISMREIASLSKTVKICCDMSSSQQQQQVCVFYLRGGCLSPQCTYFHGAHSITCMELHWHTLAGLLHQFCIASLSDTTRGMEEKLFRVVCDVLSPEMILTTSSVLWKNMGAAALRVTPSIPWLVLLAAACASNPPVKVIRDLVLTFSRFSASRSEVVHFLNLLAAPVKSQFLSLATQSRSISPSIALLLAAAPPQDIAALLPSKFSSIRAPFLLDAGIMCNVFAAVQRHPSIAGVAHLTALGRLHLALSFQSTTLAISALNTAASVSLVLLNKAAQALREVRAFITDPSTLPAIASKLFCAFQLDTSDVLWHAPRPLDPSILSHSVPSRVPEFLSIFAAVGGVSTGLVCATSVSQLICVVTSGLEETLRAIAKGVMMRPATDSTRRESTSTAVGSLSIAELVATSSVNITVDRLSDLFGHACAVACLLPQQDPLIRVLKAASLCASLIREAGQLTAVSSSWCNKNASAGQDCVFVLHGLLPSMLTSLCTAITQPGFAIIPNIATSFPLVYAEAVSVAADVLGLIPKSEVPPILALLNDPGRAFLAKALAHVTSGRGQRVH